MQCRPLSVLGGYGCMTLMILLFYTKEKSPKAPLCRRLGKVLEPADFCGEEENSTLASNNSGDLVPLLNSQFHLVIVMLIPIYHCILYTTI